jgi:hypothetical protein
MGMIAYPPVFDAKRTQPLHKAFTTAKEQRVRSARSIYTKEFIKQALEARQRDGEARILAEKQEARRQGLLAFKRRFMPEWARQIVEQTCDAHDICPSEVARDNRKHRAVKARNEAIYLVKARKPMLSSTQIGGWFGRDHTSILHSIASYSAATGSPALVGYDIANARERNRQRAAAAYSR